MKTTRDNFWETKQLTELTHNEWEALCDGCGLCCLHRLVCDDNSIVTTNVACKCFDVKHGGCKNYEVRFKIVPECMQLTLQRVKEFDWLPETCAYRLRHAGKSLPSWHPLISGTQESVRAYGVNTLNHIEETDDIILEDHIVEW
jgi:uncharacterized protein